MRFIELRNTYYNVKNIHCITYDKPYYRFSFKYKTLNEVVIKDTEISQSAKKFYEEISENNSEENSKIEKLETRCNELEQKYEELLMAIKCLPVVSGEYKEANAHFKVNDSTRGDV